MIAPAEIAGLLPHHLAELRASGLSDEMIQRAGFRSEDNHVSLGIMLNWRKYPRRMAPALVIPFKLADGSNGRCRVKPDNPRVLRNKPVKYESPRGQTNELYIPPGAAAVFDNIEIDLHFTEGEKKAACAQQHGFDCVGLVGVFGYKDGKSERLLSAFDRIKLKGRRVFIDFDSDASDNPNVSDAQSRFAKLLENQGAIVKVVNLPPGIGPDGKPQKVGLDDYLVAHGPAEFKKLVDAATDPEAVAACVMKAEASELDPGEEAQAFLTAATHKSGLRRIVYWRGSFWLWRNGAYQECVDAEVRAQIVRQLDRTYRRLSQSHASNVLDIVRAHVMLSGCINPPTWIEEPKNPSWLPSELLVTRRHIIHLPSYVDGLPCSIDATPALFTTAALDFDFDPSAPSPDYWQAFLCQLWADDQQAIDTLQEWLGLLLTIDTSYQKILLMIGPPRSGKGTIARIIRELIGINNVVAPTLDSFSQNFGLQPLIGKSAAIVSDARLSGRSDQAAIVERLLSISGEDTLTVDRKFSDAVSGKLSTRLTIISNELPRVFDAAGALASRFLVLRLTESFLGREDRGLTDRLRKELPSILLWAIRGWKRLRDRGHFIQPASGDELIADLLDISSPASQFVRECCLVGPQYMASIGDVFAEWKRWCESVGQLRPGTEQNFGRELSAAVPSIRRGQQRVSGVRERTYKGIGLKAGW